MKELSDDDDFYMEIIKKRNLPLDKEEIKEFELDKINRAVSDLRNEMTQVNNAYQKLVELLIDKGII